MSTRMRVGVVVTALACLAAGFWVGQAVGQDTGRVETIFDDITADNRHLPGIQWVYTQGLMAGVTQDEWHPRAPVTRQQMATILHRYDKYRDTIQPPVVSSTTTMPSQAPRPPRPSPDPTSPPGSTQPAAEYRMSVAEWFDTIRTERIADEAASGLPTYDAVDAMWHQSDDGPPQELYRRWHNEGFIPSDLYAWGDNAIPAEVWADSSRYGRLSLPQPPSDVGPAVDDRTLWNHWWNYRRWLDERQTSAGVPPRWGVHSNPGHATEWHQYRWRSDIGWVAAHSDVIG